MSWTITLPLSCEQTNNNDYLEQTSKPPNIVSENNKSKITFSFPFDHLKGCVCLSFSDSEKGAFLHRGLQITRFYTIFILY